MSSLTLQALRAKHGDSLLLFAEGARVLIDGGPSGVYNQVLRDHLLELERDGEDQPRIDLLIVSHIDADHIDGVLDLTAELIESREDEREPIVRIDRAWHNSFSDMIALGSSEETPSGVRARAASVASVFDDLTGPAFDPVESKLVLSSVAQGRQLRLDLKALNIDINQRFKERVVLQDSSLGPWVCGKLSISVIGPTQDELDDLRKEWKKQLEKILARDAVAATASAAALDRSVANLASIVAVAEAGGKTALLTGDARGDMILSWLREVGRLDSAGKAHFDIVKLPHHGSDRNVTAEFFEHVTADHYVVCGNGGHGNPEPATLEMLFEARPDLDYLLHMTYGPDELKTNKKFKEAGNVPKLEKVLAPPGREQVLRFPGDGERHLEVSV